MYFLRVKSSNHLNELVRLFKITTDDKRDSKTNSQRLGREQCNIRMLENQLNTNGFELFPYSYQEMKSQVGLKQNAKR